MTRHGIAFFMTAAPRAVRAPGHGKAERGTGRAGTDGPHELRRLDRKPPQRAHPGRRDERAVHEAVSPHGGGHVALDADELEVDVNADVVLAEHRKRVVEGRRRGRPFAQGMAGRGPSPTSNSTTSSTAATAAASDSRVFSGAIAAAPQ